MLQDYGKPALKRSCKSVISRDADRKASETREGFENNTHVGLALSVRPNKPRQREPDKIDKRYKKVL